MRSKRPVIIFIFVVAAVFLVVPAALCGVSAANLPQDPKAPKEIEKIPLRVPKVKGRIRMDARLDEEFWQKALVVELNYEVMPGENITPPVRTEVLLVYTDTHLYAAFRAYDPEPSAIRAVLADRDHFPDHDWVGLVLDTFNDQRRTYNFYCNPLGIQADGMQNPNGWVEWDAIWDSAGRINGRGYVVEMAVPFSSLSFQRKKGNQVWGVDARRSYPRNVRHTISLFPWDRNNNCLMCQMEKLIGFAGAKPGKNLEFDPTLSTLVTRERESFPAGTFSEKENKIEPGLTAKWGFTPNLTLNAAINPDFSHVEADAAQLDINTQFALYYPEKRPFFMEGAGIFNSPLAAVYTRSLADPDWGIKLTGKEGPHTIGFYSVRDNITNLVFPGSHFSDSTSLDMKTTGTVLRYRLDVGKASTVGFLVTGREGDDYFNRLAGIDAYLRLSRKKQVNVQFLGSQTRYPLQVAVNHEQPGDSFTGTALDVLFSHESRNFGYNVSYRQVDPNFRADLGYIPQVGYRNITGSLIFTSWRNPGHWYTSINVIPSFAYETDYDGELIYKTFNLTCNYNGPAQSVFTLTGCLGKQSYLGNIFNIDHVEVSFSMQPSGALNLGLNGIAGDHIDFANNQAASRFKLNPFISYKIGRHIFIQLDHVLERLNVEAGHLYTANVSNLKAVYQFSRRVFLRTILQYIHYNYNVENYIFPRDPKFKHLFTQLLFSYKINPRTVLFLGYSDDYYGYLQIPLTQANRTFFLKIGYALVL